MRPTTPNFNFSQNTGPSSPPETPTNTTFAFGNPSRATKRQGVQNFSRPRRNGTISPLGQGPHFSYKPSVRPEDLSPRSSTPSSSSSGSPPRSQYSNIADSAAHQPEPSQNLDPSPQRPSPQRRVVTHSNFTVEEIRESDFEIDSDDEYLEVVRPDHYEDAESDYARERMASTTTELDPAMIADLQNLGCRENDVEDDREEWLRQVRVRRRQNRLSSGSLGKRDITQSLGSDTDDEDRKPYDINEIGLGDRRLRRKVAGERSSLLYDDAPSVIKEVDEPESSVDGDIEELEMEEGQCVDRELPYYVQDTMDTD